MPQWGIWFLFWDICMCSWLIIISCEKNRNFPLCRFCAANLMPDHCPIDAQYHLMITRHCPIVARFFLIFSWVAVLWHGTLIVHYCPTIPQAGWCWVSDVYLALAGATATFERRWLVFYIFIYFNINRRCFYVLKVGEMRIWKWIRYPHFGRVDRGEILCWCGFGGLKFWVDKFIFFDGDCKSPPLWFRICKSETARGACLLLGFLCHFFSLISA